MSVKPSSAPRTSERLRERRRRERKALRIALALGLVLLAAAALYGLQSPHVRIHAIEAYGTDEPLVPLALDTLQGSYLGIIPRDSTFFYPEDALRARILATYGDIATVSLFRNGLTGLTIRISHRVPIARWCGTQYVHTLATSTPPGCYFFDDQGRLFATTSAEQVVHDTLFFAPLPAEPAPGVIIPASNRLPELFNLAREIGTLGTRTHAVGREPDATTLYLESGTRLIYREGGEQAAFTALQSAKNNLDIADGSLEYVDLRFEGRLYLKRADSATVQE